MKNISDTNLVHIWVCTLQRSRRRQLVDEIAQFNGELCQRLWGPSGCRSLWQGSWACPLRRGVCEHPWAVRMYSWGCLQWPLACDACWTAMHGTCMLRSSRTPAKLVPAQRVCWFLEGNAAGLLHPVTGCLSPITATSSHLLLCWSGPAPSWQICTAASSSN